MIETVKQKTNEIIENEFNLEEIEENSVKWIFLESLITRYQIVVIENKLPLVLACLYAIFYYATDGYIQSTTEGNSISIGDISISNSSGGFDSSGLTNKAMMYLYAMGIDINKEESLSVINKC